MPAGNRTVRKQIHGYQQVLRRIQSDYVTDANMTTGALHGLLDSSYLTAPEYKIWKERSTTGVAQVGVTVSMRALAAGLGRKSFGLAGKGTKKHG